MFERRFITKSDFGNRFMVTGCSTAAADGSVFEISHRIKRSSMNGASLACRLSRTDADARCFVVENHLMDWIGSFSHQF